MLILLIDCEKQLINGNLSSSSLQHSVNSTGIFFKGGEDLDTFTEPSTLNCNSYNVAQSLIHTPPIGTFGSGFRFDVFASSFGGRVQRIMVHDTIPKIFYRSKFSDTWNNWEKVVSNTDLQNYPKTIQFNIPIGSHVIIKEGDNRFAQLLFLQASNMNGQGIYGLSGYGEGGSRYFVSNISPNDSINIEIIGTTFKITNNFSNIVVATLTKFMGDTPTIQ